MPIARKEVRLRPLPLRVTPLQFERLTQARARDSLAIQEHVRRAIDVYLEQLDRKVLRDAERQEALDAVQPAIPRAASPAPARKAVGSTSGRAYSLR